MDFSWVYDHSGVDWDELSELYRVAPLGEKSPEDLATVFSNSKFKCFIYLNNTLVGVGRALADGVDCSYICDVAVHPEYQGLRLGKKIIENFELIKEIVSSVRTLRKNKNIAFKETLTLNIRAKEDEYDNTFNDVLIKSGSLSGIEFVSEKIKDAESFIVKTTEFYVPLKDKVNEEEEINKLNKELEHTNGFMNSVMKKLNNERFVQNAPANIIERERIKLADAKTKIKVLEERIASLK